MATAIKKKRARFVPLKEVATPKPKAGKPEKKADPLPKRKKQPYLKAGEKPKPVKAPVKAPKTPVKLGNLVKKGYALGEQAAKDTWPHIKQFKSDAAATERAFFDNALEKPIIQQALKDIGEKNAKATEEFLDAAVEAVSHEWNRRTTALRTLRAQQKSKGKGK